MKIGLGTAQFGFDYGISNVMGMPNLNEVSKIIKLAEVSGIQALDTAQSYGQSEVVLGGLIGSNNHFKLITKTLPLKCEQINLGDVKRVVGAFKVSLERMQQQKIYALLIHHVDDILAPGGHQLMNSLCELKSDGFIKKVGVSVYNQSEIEKVLSLYDVDIVQVPINIFDQRLHQSGFLKQLKAAGIEVHARSVFLQGLLLMEPSSLSQYFSIAFENLANFHTFSAGRGFTPLMACLEFLMTIEEVDLAIIGVNSERELQEIIACCLKIDDSISDDLVDYSRFAIGDERILNPSLWRE